MNIPAEFKVSTSGSNAINEVWKSSTSTIDIDMSIPTEFDGPGIAASPEDLYALALGNCFLATFKVVAHKSKLIFHRISVDVQLTVDKNFQEQVVMKKAILNIELSGVENKERALRLMQKTSENCMILNSVKTEIEFKFNCTN